MCLKTYFDCIDLPSRDLLDLDRLLERDFFSDPSSRDLERLRLLDPNEIIKKYY